MSKMRSLLYLERICEYELLNMYEKYNDELYEEMTICDNCGTLHTHDYETVKYYKNKHVIYYQSLKGDICPICLNM